MLFRVLCTACVALGLLVAEPALGQRKPPKPKMEPFAADGIVLAIALGKLQMRTTTNQDWLIWIDPKAKIQVTGTAEADFLRPGHFLRFVAKVDRRGRVQEKITKLTLFTPSEAAPVGAWPVNDTPATEDGEAKGFGEQPEQTPPAAVTSYSVAGRIDGSKKGKVTINTGRASLQIEVAEDAKIQVDFADYSVVRPDDKVAVKKGQMPEGRMGLAKATELTFELANPLTGPRKRRPIPPKKQPPKPRPDADKEKGSTDS